MTEEQLFQEAISLTGTEREEFLLSACRNDEAIRQRVEQLIKAHESPDSLLTDDHGDHDLPSTGEMPAPVKLPSINAYKLLQKIGEGGFGVVYMADQLRPVKRKVALKVIKPGMDTSAVIARFEAERQALAMMDHSNIARVFDGGATDDGRPYFVMELVKGVPITTYCDDNKLRTSERLKLFVDVCTAVQHAHQKGIIHRDIKPSNVMITLHDGKPVVKVIDFGVAKATSVELTEKTLFTAYGQMIGTPQYMSPEQAEMSGLDIDTRSDVYSLGVLLYELLTGTTPLESESLRSAGYAKMQQMIKETQPPRPSARLSGRLSSSGNHLTHIAEHRSVSADRLHREIRGDLDWIVMKSLEKDRGRRYETAIGFAKDVQRYLQREPVVACPPTISYRASRYVSRNWRQLSIVATLAVIMFISIVWIAYSHSLALERLDSLRATLEELAFNEACNGDLTQFARWKNELIRADTPPSRIETLHGIALFTSGNEGKAVENLKTIVDSDRHNSLAVAALAWAAYNAGDYRTFRDMYPLVTSVDRLESDFERLFVAFLNTYRPGDADLRAIEVFDQILESHPRWGFTFMCRSCAYMDLFHRSKNPVDLEHALTDMEKARVYMPQSDMVRLRAFVLYMNVLEYIDAFPDQVSEFDKPFYMTEATRLAEFFATNQSSFEGAANALAFYRKFDDLKADELEHALDKRSRNATNRPDYVEIENLYQPNRLSELNNLPDQDEVEWLLLKALACKELGLEDHVDRYLRSLKNLPGENGDLGEKRLDAFEILEQPKTKRLLAEDCLNSTFLWGWEMKSLSFHLGKINADELLELASPFHNQLCVANYTIGLRYLSEGKREQAKKHFRAAHKTGRYGWHDFHMSRIFLGRLEQDPNYPPWIPKDEEVHEAN